MLQWVLRLRFHVTTIIVGFVIGDDYETWWPAGDRPA
jgi:hypothetical protein